MTATLSGLTVVRAPHLADRPSWLAEHRDVLRAMVLDLGAVLVRGLNLATVPDAAAAASALAEALMVEREAFAPRTDHGGGIYATPTWPPDQPICPHHELSYATEFPALLVFCCLEAPPSGGAIALADGTAVLDDLPSDLVARFERVGWELRRTHNDLAGVPWPQAFGTNSRTGVRRYCTRHGIHYRWDATGGLHTRRRLPAVLTHPVTGRRSWFNQIAFLNEWTMEPAVREYLRAELGPDGLPFNTRYGDGTPIEESTVNLINEVYATHTVHEPWQAGDLLLVDNLRTAHGRQPYHGTCTVVMALADPAGRRSAGD